MHFLIGHGVMYIQQIPIWCFFLFSTRLESLEYNGQASNMYSQLGS